MPPSQPVIEWITGDCTLGSFILGRRNQRVCWLALGDAIAPLCEEFLAFYKDQPTRPIDTREDAWTQRVLAALNGTVPLKDVAIEMNGTPFQQSVWRALCAIPAGETRCYQEIAEAIGRPTASHAVGAAVGANHIAVFVPCHRVIRKDGSICGFRWGIERKRALQQREAKQQELAL